MKSIPIPPFSREHSLGDPHAEGIPGYPHLALQPSIVNEHLSSNISVERLNELAKYLWITGRPGHIRPLHKQLILRRKIFITQDPNLHLLWRGDAIYIMPLPEALLSRSFWKLFICSDPNKLYAPSRGQYYTAACGLLKSYTTLIQYPADFRIGIAEGILPANISWADWCLISQDVRNATSASNFPVEPRWEYGELRLSRLNLIYKFTFRGYSYVYLYTEYSAYFGKNLRVLLIAFAYCSVTLAAMQVIVSYGTAPSWVLDASYAFAMLAVSFILIVILVATTLLLYLFAYHYRETRKAWKEAQRVKKRNE